TANNLLAALDYPAILPQVVQGWNYYADADSRFEVEARVVAAWDAAGHPISDPKIDPVIGARVLGAGRMADLDPEHRRVTDLVGMELVVEVPGPATVSGRVAITQLGDYWDRTADGPTATAWQSAISPLKWSPGIERSGILRGLRDSHVPGLSIRLMPFLDGTGPKPVS